MKTVLSDPFSCLKNCFILLTVFFFIFVDPFSFLKITVFHFFDPLSFFAFLLKLVFHFFDLISISKKLFFIYFILPGGAKTVFHFFSF